MSPLGQLRTYTERRVVFFGAYTEQGCVKMRILFYHAILDG